MEDRTVWDYWSVHLMGLEQGHRVTAHSCPHGDGPFRRALWKQRRWFPPLRKADVIDELWHLSPPNSSKQQNNILCLQEQKSRKNRRTEKLLSSATAGKNTEDLTALETRLLSIQGGRGNGRGNDTINRGAGRGNGGTGIHKSVNSLSIQETSVAEYTAIRKFRKVNPTLMA